MILPDFLHRGDSGEIRFTDSRVDLYFVLECHRDGKSPDAIAAEFPSVARSAIESAIAFYAANRDEVDAYLADVRRQIAHLEATIPRADRAALQERLARRRAEGDAVVR